MGKKLAKTQDHPKVILRKVSKTFFVFLFGTLVITTCADLVKRYLATYARVSEYLEVVQDQIDVRLPMYHMTVLLLIPECDIIWYMS